MHRDLRSFAVWKPMIKDQNLEPVADDQVVDINHLGRTYLLRRKSLRIHGEHPLHNPYIENHTQPQHTMLMLERRV